MLRGLKMAIWNNCGGGGGNAWAHTLYEHMGHVLHLGEMWPMSVCLLGSDKSGADKCKPDKLCCYSVRRDAQRVCHYQSCGAHSHTKRR